MWKSQKLVTLAASCRVMCHIDGTAQAPPPVPVFPSNCPLTDDEEEQLEKAEKHHDNYDQWEAVIKAQIFTLIPDSLLIEVQKLKMAKEVCEAPEKGTKCDGGHLPLYI